MKTMVEIGATYMHYKGNTYEVIDIGTLEDTLEEAVIYTSTTDPSKTWIRKVSVWEETVEVDGEEIPRFRLLDDDDDGEIV